MAVKKNNVGDLLDRLISSRDKTENKISILAIESDAGFWDSAGKDEIDLTLKKFADTYHAELERWLKGLTKPASGSYRASKPINSDEFKIVSNVKYNAERGHFQLGTDTFKIHWLRRNSPYLKCAALDLENCGGKIRYGSGEHEIFFIEYLLISVFISTVYKRADEQTLDLEREIRSFIHESLMSILVAYTKQPYVKHVKEERFELQGVTWIVSVTRTGKNFPENVYIVAAKNAEFGNILSYENIKAPLPAPKVAPPKEVSFVARDNSDKSLGITRADFADNFNAALLERSQADDEKPFAYYGTFLLDKNDVSENVLDSGKHTAHFNTDENGFALSCFDGEKNINAVSITFYEACPDIDTPLYVAIRALYSDIEPEKISAFIREFVRLTANFVTNHKNIIEIESASKNSAPKIEKVSNKEFTFEGEIFFVQVETYFDKIGGTLNFDRSLMMLRDKSTVVAAAPEKPAEENVSFVARDTSDKTLGITLENFLKNYYAALNEASRRDNKKHEFTIDKNSVSEFSLGEGKRSTHFDIVNKNFTLICLGDGKHIDAVMCIYKTPEFDIEFITWLSIVVRALYKNVSPIEILKCLKQVTGFWLDSLNKIVESAKYAGDLNKNLKKEFTFEGEIFLAQIKTSYDTKNETLTPEVILVITRDRAVFTTPNKKPPKLSLVTRDTSDKTLGITRADFVKNFNAVLNKLTTGEDILLDDSKVLKHPSASEHIVFFDIGDENLVLGCLEGENYLCALFIRYEAHYNSALPITAILHALYNDVAPDKVLELAHVLTNSVKDTVKASLEYFLSESNRARTSIKTLSQKFQFQQEFFIVQATTTLDKDRPASKTIAYVMITRDLSRKMKPFIRQAETLSL